MPSTNLIACVVVLIIAALLAMGEKAIVAGGVAPVVATPVAVLLLLLVVVGAVAVAVTSSRTFRELDRIDLHDPVKYTSRTSRDYNIDPVDPVKRIAAPFVNARMEQLQKGLSSEEYQEVRKGAADSLEYLVRDVIIFRVDHPDATLDEFDNAMYGGSGRKNKNNNQERSSTGEWKGIWDATSNLLGLR